MEEEYISKLMKNKKSETIVLQYRDAFAVVNHHLFQDENVKKGN